MQARQRVPCALLGHLRSRQCGIGETEHDLVHIALCIEDALRRAERDENRAALHHTPFAFVLKTVQPDHLERDAVHVHPLVHGILILEEFLTRILGNGDHLPHLRLIHFVDEPAAFDHLLLQLLLLAHHAIDIVATEVVAVLQLAVATPHPVTATDVLQPGDAVAQRFHVLLVQSDLPVGRQPVPHLACFIAPNADAVLGRVTEVVGEAIAQAGAQSQ